MRKILIISLISIVTITNMFAQPAPPAAEKSKITGKIVDAIENTPLEFATVSVYTKDSTLVTGTITGNDGVFNIEVKPGNYYLVVQFIAYQKRVINNVSVNSRNQTVEVGTVRLESETKQLSEVTVRGEKSEMVIGVDRKIFNVGKDLSNTGNSAAQILDNIPTVSVDAEGTISLRGSQNLQVLIDGKPSGLVSSGNTNALNSLPGNMIDRVEIITNPSARYQAQGMAGIINIILKKDQRRGVNGSFELSAGHPDDYSAAANVNFRREHINYFINYGVNYDKRPGNGSSFQRFMLPDTSFITRLDRNRTRSGFSQNLRGGADIFLGPKTTLTAAGLVNIGDENNATNIRYQDYTADEILQKITYRHDDESEQEQNMEFSLNLDKKFDTDEHKLTAYVQYRDNNDVEKSKLNENIANPSGEIINPDAVLQQSRNEEKQRNILVQADYVKPFSEDGKFETGYRSEFRKITNPYKVEQQNSEGNWYSLPGYSNNFDYTENIYAAYLQGSNKFGKFSLQLGLRSELSDIYTRLKETNEDNHKTYIDFFPTIHTSFRIDDLNSLQLSYSRRINRPHFWFLNPFHTFSDARNIRTGNPNLDPEYTDAYETGYLYNNGKTSLYGGFYYNHTTGDIERIHTVDSAGISYMMPINLGIQDSYGAETNFSFEPFKWWNLSANFNFFRRMVDGTYEGQNLSSDTWSWDTRINSRMRFENTINFQTTFFYRGQQETPQGLRKPFYMMNMALGKDIFKGKGTLTLNVRDVLNSREFRYILMTDELYSDNKFRWSERSISLSFIYRLNQKKKMGPSQGGQNQPAGGGDDMEF